MTQPKTAGAAVKTPARPPAKKAAAKKASAKKTSAPKTARKAPAAGKAVPAPEAAPAGKPKLVRDSFTIPKPEYAALEALKLRAARLGHPVKKSEVLRAGVKALDVMADAALLSALRAVPSLKTGRPKAGAAGKGAKKAAA